MKMFLSVLGSAFLVLLGLPIILFGLAMIPVIFLISLAIFLLFISIFIALQLLGVSIPVYQKLPSGRKVQIGELRRFKYVSL